MRANIFIALLVAVAWNCDAQTHRGEAVNPARIGNVLHCLQSKLGDLDYLPPRPTPDEYRVRYFYGIQHPWTDERNELHLLVYGEGERSATLYEVYFETREGKPVISLGLAGKFTAEDKRLEPSEILFGIGTYDRIRKLASVIAKKPAVAIPGAYVRPGKAVCDAP
jgi:hypothetical protein